MNDNHEDMLVILAGGQSRRMGQDKAALELGGTRLVDLLIQKYTAHAGQIILSAPHDYGTGYEFVADDPDSPPGPVGAICSVARHLRMKFPRLPGFVTVPVDAPFAPDDLVDRLTRDGHGAIASDGERIHPTFGYWRCDIVHSVCGTHDMDQCAPSLHWLARQCDAQVVEWTDAACFTNINTPDDIVEAEARMKKAGA